jgi:hypothetical protein
MPTWRAAGRGRTLSAVPNRNDDHAKDVERIRVERLREDAARSMSENLRAGIALSHKLLAFTGAAREQ